MSTAPSPTVCPAGPRGVPTIKVLRHEGDFVLFRFDPEERFPDILADWCTGNGVQSAGILCGIGMLRDIEIGLYDGSEYTRHRIDEPSEVLSLQGNVSMKEGNPFVHLHVSLAGHDFTAKGGHLFGGEVYMTIELVMRIFQPGLVRKPVGGVFWQMDCE